MKLLLDTHLLIWVAQDSEALPSAARALIGDLEHELFFSVASVWEVAIKHAMNRSDFRVDPHLFRRALLDNHYGELPITSEQAIAAGGLPALHRDPFDRLLIGQSMVVGALLLTSDRLVAQYDGPIRRV